MRGHTWNTQHEINACVFSVPASCSQRRSLKRPSLARLQLCRPVKKCCNTGKAATMSAAPGERAHAFVLLCFSCAIKCVIPHCWSVFFYCCAWSSWEGKSSAATVLITYIELVCVCACVYSSTHAFLIHCDHWIIRFGLRSERFWDIEPPHQKLICSKTDMQWSVLLFIIVTGTLKVVLHKEPFTLMFCLELYDSFY